MNDTTTAAVIGSGIAGTVTAIGLAEAGIDATIYEAYAGPAGGVGGMLGLAPNGVDALAVLGLDRAVLEVAEPVSGMVIQSWTGKRLAQFNDPTGEPILHVIWRADLHRVLYEQAIRRGVKVEHSHQLVSTEANSDSVTARFSNGASVRADILVGADGVRSTVRSFVDPTAPAPSYTGLLGFGGWARDVDVPGTNGSYHMVYGKRAFFGYQVMDDGRTGWFANLPYPRKLTLAEARQAPAGEWLQRLNNAFTDDRTPATSIVRATQPEELMVVGGLEIMPAAPRWSRDRVVLVGDAAHVPSPSSGQGASMAIESAVELARCLRDLPHAQAFAAYDAIRRDRVNKVIALAARTNSHKAAGPFARLVRDAIMPLAMKMAKPEAMAWQYDHHIEWNAAVVPPDGA